MSIAPVAAPVVPANPVTTSTAAEASQPAPSGKPAAEAQDVVSVGLNSDVSDLLKALESRGVSISVLTPDAALEMAQTAGKSLATEGHSIANAHPGAVQSFYEAG